MKKYRILSPDGFDINMDQGFKTKKSALEYLTQWINSFQAQGYYSQICYNGYKRQIPLSDIKDYCTFITN